jgi:catechol 2,3-dioxygenase-like lactoylglutathione lyase family enzyme
MIPSYDLRVTGQFFTDILDFSVVMETGNYSIFRKNNLTVHVLPAGVDIGQMEFYLEVDNVDELWRGIEDRVRNLRVKQPHDRDYGMRELHIEIPQTNALIFIGQELK